MRRLELKFSPILAAPFLIAAYLALAKHLGWLSWSDWAQKHCTAPFGAHLVSERGVHHSHALYRCDDGTVLER